MANLSAADDSFEVHLDDLLEQQSPVTFDVVKIKNARPFAA